MTPLASPLMTPFSSSTAKPSVTQSTISRSSTTASIEDTPSRCQTHRLHQQMQKSRSNAYEEMVSKETTKLEHPFLLICNQIFLKSLTRCEYSIYSLYSIYNFALPISDIACFWKMYLCYFIDWLQVLPICLTKEQLWREYSASSATGQSVVQLTSFRLLWHQLVPHVVIDKPKSDLCWVCQRNNAHILRAVNIPEAMKSATLLRQDQYLREATTERTTY